MHIVRGVVVVGVIWTGLAGFLPPAGADCSGPMVTLGSTVADRGQQFVVIGRAMGDNCYDTGPPPEGEGILGRPLEDLEVVVAQGGSTAVMAEGKADEDYSFWVQVVVPETFQPGPARIELLHDGDVIWSSTSEYLDLPFRISDQPAGDLPPGTASIGWQNPIGSNGPGSSTAASSPDDTPTTVGEGTAPARFGASADVDDDSPLVPGLIGGLIGAVAATTVALGVRRRGAAKMG